MLLIAVFLNFFFTNAFHGVPPAQGRLTSRDTTIDAIRVNLDVVSNTWKIEWLAPVKRLHIVVTRLDGKKHMDQTFEESVNGDFTLQYLPPGMFVVYIHKDGDLPLRLLIQQNDF